MHKRWSHHQKSKWREKLSASCQTAFANDRHNQILYHAPNRLINENQGYSQMSRFLYNLTCSLWHTHTHRVQIPHCIIVPHMKCSSHPVNRKRRANLTRGVGTHLMQCTFISFIEMESCISSRPTNA